MIRLLLVVLLFIVVFPVFSQTQFDININEIKGQYIIQANPDTDVRYILEKSNTANRGATQSTYTLKQIMNQPLNLWLITYSGEADEKSIIAELKSKREFTSVIKNKIIKYRNTPNDPLFINQWQYKNMENGLEGNDMDMTRAWDIATGGLTPSGDTIVVCVIDDGVNANHEDLQGNIWLNNKEIPENGIDDDQNGYVDDYKGWNITKNSDDVHSGGGHGTPVVGIVGAKGNNGIGVSGVNWNVKVMMVNYGSATEANALGAYAYAYKMRKLYNETIGKKGAYIVATNASWGVDNTKADEAPLWCALYDSLGQVGILNCGATTNAFVDVDEEGDLPTSCTSEYLIAVTNMTKQDVKLEKAGFGRKSIDLGAYGHNAYTLSRVGYGNFGGTSGATPHVAGMVGLLYSIQCSIFDSISKANPSASALIAKDMILNGTLSLPSLQGITTTGGKLNAFRAASNLRTLCETCSPPAGVKINAEDESATVHWLSGTEANISIRYRKSTDLTWIIIPNFINGRMITGLQHCTEYEFQISSNCGYLPEAFGYSKFFITGGCCTKPEIGDLLSLERSLQVNWSSLIDAEYLLQYKDPDGDWKDTLIIGNTFNLSNLEECSAYFFRIQASCTKYGDFSALTDTFSVSSSCAKCTENEYCKFGRKDATDEWIESLSIAGESVISGTSGQGYRDFAGLTDIKLLAGSTYPFKIITGYSSSSFSDFYKILIDLDQDGKWSVDELVFETPTGVQDSVRGEIHIPTNTKEGLTRMRVIISYDQFEGGCDDTKFEYGEVEDYCVKILKEGCVNNVNVKIGDIHNNSLKFFASYENARQNNVKVDLRIAGTNDEWTSRTGKDSVFFDGLEKCKLYEFQYYALCADRISEPSNPDTVRTACINHVFDIKNSIIIAPNPAANIITISAPLDQLNDMTLIMKDMTGKNVLNRSNVKIIVNFDLDISSLLPGIYIFELSGKDGRKFLSKVVKL